MRDLVSWYLVELRRRMRGIDPQQRVEDFLLETKTHLDEAIEDMTSRGISEDAAVKSAIADFGHPGVVVAGFKGRRALSPLLYWTLVASAVLAIASVSNHFVGAAGDIVSAQSKHVPFGFGLYIGMFLGFAFLLGLVWRRWAAVPITVGALIAVAGWGVYTSQDLLAFDNADGSHVVMSKTMVDEQAKLRDEWLKEYRETVKGKDVAPQGINLLMYMRIEGNQLYPHRTRGYSDLFSALPSGNSGRTFYRSIVPLGQSEDRDAVALSTTTDYKAASEAWSELKDEYFAYTGRLAERLTQERASLAAPRSVSSTLLLQQIIGRPALLVVLYGLLALLANALAISLGDVIGAFLRHGWKRSLA